jgi:hypothetical protein
MHIILVVLIVAAALFATGAAFAWPEQVAGTPTLWYHRFHLGWASIACFMWYNLIIFFNGHV